MDKRGSTVIELLITSVILAMVLGAIGDLFLLHEKSYLKTESGADTERLAAAFMDEMSRRIRAAYFIAGGSNTVTGPVLFPLPAYDSGANGPDSSGNYTALTQPGNWIGLAEDPFATDILFIQFYRPSGNVGGTIYIYSNQSSGCGGTTPHNAPPPCSARALASGAQNPLEMLEIWSERGWAVLRITFRDHYGNLIQNSTAAYIRYYN